MKIQDIGFIVVLLVLLCWRNPKLLIAAGLISLILSIPLFSAWIFFTAQRLTYYAAAFFLVAIVLYLISNKKRQ
jgi:hypothetical protein